MDWWQLVLTIIGSMSFGSIITSCITTTYQRRKLLFEIKLNKYSALIQSLQSSNPQTPNEIDDYLSKLMQVELICTKEIMDLCRNFVRNDRNMQEKLIDLMREDLKRSHQIFDLEMSQ